MLLGWRELSTIVTKAVARISAAAHTPLLRVVLEQCTSNCVMRLTVSSPGRVTDPIRVHGFDFRLRYLALGAALFAVFKGCSDDAAIVSVSSGYFLFPEMIRKTTRTRILRTIWITHPAIRLGERSARPTAWIWEQKRQAVPPASCEASARGTKDESPGWSSVAEPGVGEQ